jgi:signal transduction histidine kinase
MAPRERRASSIARRLFISATVLSFLILLLAGLVLTAVYRSSAEAAFDEQLSVYLRALVADIASLGDDSHVEIGQLGDPRFEIVSSGWYWQITRLDGDKPDIRGSKSLFAARLPRLPDDAQPGLGGARRGYASGPDDRTLRIVERVIDTGDQGLYLVQVAATTEEIDQEIKIFELDLVITFTLLGMALVGSVALQLRYGLRPLRLLQGGVAAIRRGEAEKIEGAFPQDIAPLASELNLLLAANREVVERARTQVGNLAHALKTPLSVIINEAAADQGALAAKVAEQAAAMRDQLGYHLDRARAAVRAGTIGSVTDIAPAVAALQRTFAKIYQARDIAFSAEVPATLRFLGERQDLDEMIGNLMDNAGKWARREVLVEGMLDPAQAPGDRPYALLTIDDDGPGLAPELREAALRRGQRLDETKPGSGLGLSIVVDLAGLYGGTLTLEASPAGGLRARLRLPAL